MRGPGAKPRRRSARSAEQLSCASRFSSLQSLVDDNLVRQEKIGASNYFWCGLRREGGNAPGARRGTSRP